MEPNSNLAPNCSVVGLNIFTLGNETSKIWHHKVVIETSKMGQME